MHIEIKQSPFDPYQEVSAYQQKIKQVGKFGATATFVGTMRDMNEGEAVQKMELEYYPGMTEKHLEKICKQAFEKWDLLDCLVIHRVGEIHVADPIVLVSVWSAHRLDAFEACRFIMEDVKSKAPFWKKETIESGQRWVEKNTSGYSN